MEYDVVGLVEIQSDQAVLELVNELNHLDKNAKWNVIQTDKPLMHNNLAANSAVKEYSSFLYKETLLKVIPIGGNNKWLAYDNSYWQDFGYTTGLKETGYMRPPVGVKFETTCGIKNDFTFVINHFDSPGGDTQEQAEAKNLYNTMKWFDEKDGNNDDLIFMGDTNIKLGNEKELFSFMFGNNYKSLIPESEANKTSLGLNLDRYSEPYDKAFIKTNLVYKNANIYKLYDFVKDGVYKYDSITTLDKWKKYIESQGKSYKKDYSYIRSAISDHCPISFDLYLDKNDPF